MWLRYYAICITSSVDTNYASTSLTFITRCIQYCHSRYRSPKNITSQLLSSLFSCFFFTLVSLSPHSTHLQNTELPISFSVSMSPPQHAHFMTRIYQRWKAICCFAGLDLWCICLHLSVMFFLCCCLMLLSSTMGACSYAFSHLIVVIPPLCKLLLRYHIMQEKVDKRYHHIIGRSLKNI